MAKTQDLRRRIRSIRNTMQLTRAMKLVSASKLRRAQERILRSRHYARKLAQVLSSVAARTSPEEHPLFEQRGDRRVRIVVLTGDKGLCGSFNANILRRALTLATDEHPQAETDFVAVGKRGRDYLKRVRQRVVRDWADVFRAVEFPIAAEISHELMDAYVSGQVDRIYLVYNEFKSAIQARPVTQRLLPVEPADIPPAEVGEEYLYEPASRELLDSLIPHYVEQSVFQGLLESAAAEHAARMTAMDSATKNAAELIDALTLTMNRVRQAAITTEIIEVVSGAEAQG
jgi:F-type H+-transporting ATPase subunit gamma